MWYFRVEEQFSITESTIYLVNILSQNFVWYKLEINVFQTQQPPSLCETDTVIFYE